MNTLDEQIKNIRKQIELEKYIYTKKELNLRTLDNFGKYLNEIKKNFEDLTEEDILNIAKSLKSRSYSSIGAKKASVNEILSYANRYDIKINSNGIHESSDKDKKNFDIKQNIIDTSDIHFTKKEIQQLCESFINPVDKFIVYGLFCGIDGKSRCDLLNLKIEQINLDEKIISLSNKNIEMDDYMYEILKCTLKENSYKKYIQPGLEESTSIYYDLNMKSKFVIKTKPCKTTNDGLNAMKISGFNQRIKTLKEFSKCNILPKCLVKSGAMHKMYKIKNSRWTQGEIEAFLKKNNYKMQAFELKLAFENKYNIAEQKLDILENINPNYENLNFMKKHSIEDEIRNKELGYKGELFILNIEKEKVKSELGDFYANKVKQILEENDLAGYDILYWNKVDGKIIEKYIEVKTTKFSKNEPFYISSNEVKFSKKNDKSYYLYRIYNYDIEKCTGEYFVIKGNIEKQCNLEPQNYIVNI